MLRWFKREKKQPLPRRRRSFFRPLLEVLEDRRLLSTGLLQGTVVNDQTGAPQNGATVSLYDNNGNFLSSQTSGASGASGSYLFTGLTPGTYKLVETPPSNFTNDTTHIVVSPVESVVSSTNSSITVTIPSSVQLSLAGSQFKLSGTNFNGTNNTPGIAATEILSLNIDGNTSEWHDIYVGQFIASANSGPSFYTFCVDLANNHQLSSGSTNNVFNVQEEPDLTGEGPSPINNPTNVSEIAYLYNQFGTATLSSVNAAALQVAIWSFEFNNDPANFTAAESGNGFQLLGPDTRYISQTTYNSVVSQAGSYISAAMTAEKNPLGQYGQAIFLAPNGKPISGGEQGMIAPGSLNFSNIPQGTPTITTTPNQTSVTLGGSTVNLKDTATLSGGNNPTGSITFTLIAPNGTTVDTETVTVNGDGNYTTPTGYTLPTNATVTGLYQWDASYSGDQNNSPASDNNATNEQVLVSPATPSIVTNPNTTNVTLGTGSVTLTDSATLSGTYSGTGSITFTLYYNGGATPVDTETAPVNGDGAYSTPTGYTLPTTGPVTGTYQWDASYSGDGNNNTAIDLNNPNEQVTVSPATPQLTTQGSETANGVVGTAVLSDSATLSGGYHVAAGSPAPTITFTLIAPNGSTVYTETQTVTGDTTYTTTGTGTGSDIATQVGLYYWNVSYNANGNTNNNSVTHSGVNDTHEQLTTTPATPQLTTQGSETANGVVGTAVLSDTATLSGGYMVAAGSPAPTLTFTLIAPNGSTVYTETQTVTGTGNYTTTGTGSGSDVATQVGTYYWNVSYSGNTFNNSVTENGQNQPSEQLTTVQATPQLTTQASESGNVVGSAVISDSATLSGGYMVAAGSPVPTITFNLVGPNGSTVYTETQTVTGDTTYTTTGNGTGSDVATQVGTYYWVVTYSGNTFNNSVTDNGQNQPSEQESVIPATPQLTTQGSETASGVVSTAVLSDSATLSGGFMVGAGSPAPTLTFSLIAPNGSTVYTESQTVTGDTTYTTTGTGTGSDVATQVGTYYWNVSYSGNAFNNSVTHSGVNDSHEQLTTTQATPQLTTQGSETANGVVGTAVLSDTATLSGGYMVAAGSPAPTLTFTLIAPNGSTVYTETQTVMGTGNYTTTGTGSGSELATQVGTYYWNVSYSGNTFNNSVTHNGQNDTNEQLTTIPASPAITTTPYVITTTGTGGQYATIGFWHNKNGQAVITNFDSGPSSTVLGNALASNYANLFGYANPYTSATLGASPGTAPGLAGLTNTQVAAVYLGLWTPSGLQKNTYVQAFAVALGLHASGGAGTFNVGSNGAAFGVANNTTLSVASILQAVSNNFNPTTGLFYNGNSTLTSAANNVLDGINSSGENPGGGSVVSVVQLNDSATLTGGYHEGGTITFYLFAPGVTPNSNDSNNVYSDTVTVNGDGTYNTTMGTNPGGYMPTATGTYQWVAVYSGDPKNNGVTSPFGSEPWTVGQASPTITTVPGGSVALGSGNKLTDTATLSDASNPGGTITFYLFAPGVTPNSNDSNNVYSDTVTVTGNGNYSTATGTNPGGYLPTVTGTYEWLAVYSGDAKNAPASNNFGDEPETVSQASPSISTTPGGTVVLDSGNALTDSATLSGGYNPGGSITFYLFAPGVTPNGNYSNNVYSDQVTVNGNGTYTTSAGNNPGGFIPAVTGTFEWVAVYSGDTNNSSVTSPFGSEGEAVVSSGPVSAGDFATIGFWHNKNGQAVINSFNGGSSATQLGNWLATNFPNLFGTSNPYISSTLKQFGATSLAGLTNAQVATVYENLWNPSGVTKNTYVQAFAVALGVYADTASLGYNSTAASFGFQNVSGGGGNLTFNIGSNGAAFGVANNTSLTVSAILSIVNSNFDAVSGTFFKGNKNQQTLTSDLNNVLNGINTTGDIN